jgi:hypothetical protein
MLCGNILTKYVSLKLKVESVKKYSILYTCNGLLWKQTVSIIFICSNVHIYDNSKVYKRELATGCYEYPVLSATYIYKECSLVLLSSTCSNTSLQ